MPNSRLPTWSGACLAALLGTGCASLQSSDNILGIVTPYRIDIVQGNVVTQEQLALIKPGLSRTQVREIMGSPLLTDPFHADRWDYVFTIRRQGAEPQRRSIVLAFEGDTLKQIDAPELPSEREFVNSIDTFERRRSVGPLALTEDQRKALPVPPPQAAQPAPPATPPRDYPPLEPVS
jgi:outer membrane protein assembly factor BamE